MGVTGMNEIIDTKEAARRLGIGPERVRQLCEAGRVEGAYRIGERNRASWRIPVRKDGLPDVIPGERKGPPLKRRT
jgi:hypothetical protein